MLPCGGARRTDTARNSPPPPWQETIKDIIGQSTHKDTALERDIQDLLSNVGRSGLGEYMRPPHREELTTDLKKGIEPPDDIHPWGG